MYAAMTVPVISLPFEQWTIATFFGSASSQVWIAVQIT